MAGVYDLNRNSTIPRLVLFIISKTNNEPIYMFLIDFFRFSFLFPPYIISCVSRSVNNFIHLFVRLFIHLFILLLNSLYFCTVCLNSELSEVMHIMKPNYKLNKYINA